MEALRLETFLSSDTDWEINQYKILGGIKKLQENFTRKRLYPTLSDLIDLVNVLEEILKHKKNLNGSFPKQITEYDLKNKKIIFKTIENLAPDVEILFDLIEWALPVIKDTVEEGIVLYDFVEKNLKISQVGLLPLYKGEGYFIVPDNVNLVYQVYKFECSIFSSGKEPFRSLKTNLVDEVEQEQIQNSPEAIKLELISRYREMPNPATYYCETELDFPFSETLFPIAKRKLIGRVAA